MAKKVIELKFTCPNCKDNRLEVIETNAIVSSAISNLDENGEFEYINFNIDDSTVDRFQCVNCGYVLKNKKGNKITDNLGVIKWLLRHSKK
jgi:rubredoxin